MKNVLLKPYLPYMKDLGEISPQSFKQKCSEFGIPLNRTFSEKTVFEWESIKPVFSIPFDYEGDGPIISKGLTNSELANTQEIIISVSHSIPMIQIPTEIFIENWYDFFCASGGETISVVDISGKLLLEFVEHSFDVRSNFFISTSAG